MATPVRIAVIGHQSGLFCSDKNWLRSSRARSKWSVVSDLAPESSLSLIASSQILRTSAKLRPAALSASVAYAMRDLLTPPS